MVPTEEARGVGVVASALGTFNVVGLELRVGNGEVLEEVGVKVVGEASVVVAERGRRRLLAESPLWLRVVRVRLLAWCFLLALSPSLLVVLILL